MFLVVCRMFVFLTMLDARGNLDLESLEELLTSSGTPGPRAPQFWALGPLRANGFLALHFCIIFRDVFCIVFSYFLMDFDLHFGAMLASFSMFFASLFRASVLHGFFINFARISICFFKYFVDFHGPTSNWRKPQKQLFLRYFCIVYTFANNCFF